MLRVKVDEDITMKFTFRQVVCTVHTRFLVSGDKTLNRSVLQCLVFHYSHNGSHTKSIVSTECSTLSPNPTFIVDISLQWVGLEVMCTFG